MSTDAFPDTLATPRLVLRRARRSDALAWLRYHLDNREHLRRWEPTRDETFFTEAAMVKRLEQMETSMVAGQAVHLLVREPGGSDLVGECHFTQIVRGPFQACHLGFSLAHTHEGRGLMTEVLSMAIEMMFSGVGLHRILANYRPENHRSGRLLERLGFEQEGRARAYLHIDGAWADHILTSRIRPGA
ncbi:alanine acetyltransferase [Caldimonas brevitalea]|uniref:Alanine acetyltransferase n=2 Tax=Caldimonas brevitalea TaxID=413882 RepID=A0A0G3BR31_9BURK|nr:alanine acetyltransferase [Caldimonas brevitalea]